jgi:hypothetical protein
MDNQHKIIEGYRDLSKDEIDMMNEGKAIANIVGEWIDRLQSHDETDKRWVSVAKTDLQKGFMAAIRAVAKPTTFG